MPLIKHFKSTYLWKAFTLNSIAASLIVVIAITVKQYLDRMRFYDINEEKSNKKSFGGTDIANVIITLLITFCTSMVAYLLMYFLFGFGGGMLSTP